MLGSEKDNDSEHGGAVDTAHRGGTQAKAVSKTKIDPGEWVGNICTVPYSKQANITLDVLVSTHLFTRLSDRNNLSSLASEVVKPVSLHT